MTLGDRVVVMHGGVAQQIGTPDELYERPANLFVAGFIGSPAMNFFPATLTADRADAAVRGGDADAGSPGDDRNTPQAGQRHRRRASRASGRCRVDRRLSAHQGADLQVKVELVESLGADKYVYFTTAGSDVHSAQLDELVAESELPANQFVARVPAESKAALGQAIEVACDTTKLAVFDADSGVNLTIAVPSAAE